MINKKISKLLICTKLLTFVGYFSKEIGVKTIIKKYFLHNGAIWRYRVNKKEH